MSETGSRHNLGAETTSFVGRGSELGRVRELLGHARLVTLLGPGGVGKSRIARATGVRLARSFADGVRLVDVSAASGSEFIERVVQDALPGAEGLLSAAARLADRHLLLILDDCDPHQRAVGDLAAELLQRCPELRILATSRVPLEISAEHVVQVAPFTAADRDRDGVADAVALFRDRAVAASEWEPADTPVVEVERLCERLDGLPLAIELAALRTRTMTIGEIDERLGDRFALLHGGPRDVHPRHRSLLALLDWAWENCSPQERSVWAQMSVCGASSTAAAVRGICVLPDAAEIDTALDGLVQQSVLVRRGGAVPRFELLGGFRQYGATALGREPGLPGDPREEDIRQRHLEYHLASIKAATDERFSHRQLRYRERLTADLPQLRSAFEYAAGADPAAAAELFAELWFHWVGCGHLGEARTWLARLDAATDPETWPASTAWTAGWVRMITGDRVSAERHLAHARAEAARTGDAAAAGWATALTGALAVFQGEHAVGTALYERAITGARERGDDAAAAVFLYQLGESLCVTGDLDRAERCAAETLALSRAHGDRWCHGYAQWIRALVAFLRGDDATATELAADALAASAAIDDQLAVALTAELTGWLAARAGRGALATAVLGTTADYWAASGSLTMGLEFFQRHRAEAQAAAAGVTGVLSADASLPPGRTMEEAAAAALSAGTPANPGHGAPREHTGFDELTPREREIADLVATGMTNREIAGRLVIGKRTVDTHVAHVLTKLGLRRRTEIALRWGRTGSAAE